MSEATAFSTRTSLTIASAALDTEAFRVAKSCLIGKYRCAWEELVVLKYMTDANTSGLARELRARGIDCDTVHKLILNNEDSRIQIKDPQIISFLRNQAKQITLITLDTELAEYCGIDGIPCIRVQDLVADYIKNHAVLG